MVENTEEKVNEAENANNLSEKDNNNSNGESENTPAIKKDAEVDTYKSEGCFPLYWCFRASLRIIFKLFWRWKRIGKEKMPKEGGVIIASNHASFLDPMLLGSFYDRPVGFMARKTLFKNKIFGFLIRKHYAFPLDREGDPRSALRAMGEKLQHGECVVMFPEGTRTKDGRLGKIRRGIGMISVKNKAVILPTYIGGSFDSWPRNAKFPKPYPLRIEVGEPIIPADCENDRALAKSEEKRIHNEVESQLKILEQKYFEVVGAT
jgi:1-acyl-sn-glycerol-3-phosphate acyltransferase